MKRLSIILLSLVITASISGQDVNVTAAFDTSSVLLGDQIHFRLSAEIPPGASLRMPLFHGSLAENIMVLGLPKRDSATLEGGVKRVTDEYLVTSFEEGHYTIDSVGCEVTLNGTVKRYLTTPVSLDVTRPTVTPADTTDVIYDIAAPREAPVIFAEVLPWILIVMVMGLIVWLLMKYLPRNPLAKLIKKEKPAVPAHIIAFRELDRLRSEELWQKGEIKEYYSRLSDILRRYIDGRFGIQSPELTTDETVRMLQKSGSVTADVLLMVKSVLSDSDMVKFAKHRPADELHSISIEKATKFVTVTKPAEVTNNDSTQNDRKGGME